MPCIRRALRTSGNGFPRSLSVLCVLSLLLAALLASPSFAQTGEEPAETVDEEIVVSASLVELPKKRSGSTVTVLDREAIERANKTTVLELLRTVPGVEVAQSGGPGRLTSVFVRGGNSSHTLVLVDGVRANSNSTGAVDFADITTDNLERIEILRGPQGVLFGSEAVTGVVSIQTRRGAGPAKAWVRGALGSDDYYRLGAGVQGGDENFNYSFAASQLSTDGVSAASEAAGNTETDPWENLTLSGRLGSTFWGDGRAEVALRYTEGEASVDGFAFGIGPVDDLDALQDHRLFTGSLTLSKPVTERWTQKLVLSSTRDDLEGSDPTNFFSNFEILNRTTEVRTQADVKVSDQHTVSVGYRFEDREAESVGSFDESDTLRAFFAESLWSWGGRYDLSLGLRNDDHSVFGGETTWRLTLSALLSDSLRLHGSAGTGFRAPTFNDLYFPGFGNLDLVPETSEGFDLGVEGTFSEGDVVVDLTVFDTDFDDLILFTFPAGIVNVARANSRGVELTLSWRVSERVSIDASHTWNETEDLDSGLQLARRPEHRTTLSLAFRPVEKLSGSLSAFIGRDRIDSTGLPLDDYERVDLALEYRLNSYLRPFLRVENLFDSEYEEVAGYTVPGATVAVGARLGF